VVGGVVVLGGTCDGLPKSVVVEAVSGPADVAWTQDAVAGHSSPQARYRPGKQSPSLVWQTAHWMEPLGP
jgi:hypothetical protein